MQERTEQGIGYIAAKLPLDPERTTIVFIHGAGGSRLFWKEQVQGLDSRVNALAIDLPGHGISEGDGKDRVEDYARAVIKFLKDIDAPNPIPCGLSMGGAITQQILLDHSDLVKAGILISTGAKLKVATAIFETIENDYNGFVDMIGKFAASEKTDPKLLQPFKEETARCKSEVTYGDFQACNRFDVTKRLASIKIPILVITAEDDKLTPPKYGAFLEQNIRNANRTHILDAGHIVPMEKPEEVNWAIVEFLDKTGL